MQFDGYCKCGKTLVHQPFSIISHWLYSVSLWGLSAWSRSTKQIQMMSMKHLKPYSETCDVMILILCRIVSLMCVCVMSRQCFGEVPGSESGRRAVWRVAGTQEWLSVLLGEVWLCFSQIRMGNSFCHWQSLYNDQWGLINCV